MRSPNKARLLAPCLPAPRAPPTEWYKLDTLDPKICWHSIRQSLTPPPTLYDLEPACFLTNARPPPSRLGAAWPLDKAPPNPSRVGAAGNSGRKSGNASALGLVSEEERSLQNRPFWSLRRGLPHLGWSTCLLDKGWTTPTFHGSPQFDDSRQRSLMESALLPPAPARIALRKAHMRTRQHSLTVNPIQKALPHRKHCFCSSSPLGQPYRKLT